MPDRNSPPGDGKTVFLFGPQALSFNEEDFKRLRSTIVKLEDYGWILDAVAELPTCLESIAKGYPKLMTMAKSSLSLLESLQEWFATGKTPRDSFNLPNVLLSPLVVITQLVQYLEYRKISHHYTGEEPEIHDLLEHDVETLGLCTGFLSSLVVSCSTNRESFEKFGTVAIRLGMLIGMVVDSQDGMEEGGSSKSLATIWHSVDEKQKMLEILDRSSEVRTSFQLSLSDELMRTADIHFCLLRRKSSYLDHFGPDCLGRPAEAACIRHHGHRHWP